GPNAADRRAKLEFVLTPSIFDDDGWIELLGLWPNIVLPDDPACFRVQRHQDAAARAAGVIFGAGEELLQRAAAEDYFDVRHDRRRRQNSVEMLAWEGRRTAIDFPTFGSGRGI